MKIKTLAIALVFLTLFSELPAHGQTSQGAIQSTSGTDFWVTFLNNDDTPSQAVLSVIATAPHNATLTATNPQSGWTTTANLTAGDKVQITFPTNSTLPSGQPYALGYHITSDQPVTLFACNYKEGSWDFCNVLPASVLSDTYLIQSYPNNSDHPDNVAFVATEDNTILTMTLPCTVTQLSQPVGSLFTVTLAAGQSVMLRANQNGNFSGMQVSSNNKSFACFQGCGSGRVGSNATNTGRDHFFEQAMPVTMWGTKFVANSTLDRYEGDRILVTAGHDNCAVSVNGTLATTLNSGQSYEVQLLSNSTAYITTTQPAYACLYMVSYANGGSLGDPGAATLPPVNRWIQHSDFIIHQCNNDPWNSFYITETYLNIVAQNSAVGTLTLDGQVVPASSFAAVPGTAYSQARLNLAFGAHVIDSPEGTFSARAYGLGSWVGFGYNIGLNIAEEEPVEPIRDTVEYRDTTCLGTLYSGYGFTFDASRCSPGTFHLWDSVDLGDTLRWTVLHLEVLPTVETLVEVSLTAGDTLAFADTLLTQMGEYRFTYTAANGCDSVVVLRLTYRLIRDTVEYRDTTCLGTLYSGYGFTFDASQCSPGTFHLWDSAVVGDTLRSMVLHLEVLPTVETLVEVSLTAGDTLAFADTLLTQMGEYRFTYTAANGCDSVVVLRLTYESTSITASADDICPGDSVELTAQGTLVFHWSATPPDSTLASQQGRNPIVVHPTTTTTYILADATGNTIASHTVGVAPTPVICIENSRKCIDFDHPVVTMRDCSEGRHRTTWDFDDGAHFIGERMRRIVPYPLPDSIAVTMTSCNRWGCCADTTVVMPTCTLSVWFPNIFTPDEATNNRFGCVTTYEVVEWDLRIFNRWGLHVWSTQDITQPWDGTHDGTPVKQEAYIYQWSLRDAENRFLHGVGTVTLLR